MLFRGLFYTNNILEVCDKRDAFFMKFSKIILSSWGLNMFLMKHTLPRNIITSLRWWSKKYVAVHSTTNAAQNSWEVPRDFVSRAKF